MITVPTFGLLAAVQMVGLVASIGALSAASISDLKTREVSNWYWMAYGPVGLGLFIAQLLLSDNWLVIAVSGGVTVAIAFALFFLGLVGGADSKALMCLGLAMPVLPSFLSPFWQSPFAFYPFPIMILINSFLLSITATVFILARNLVVRLNGKGLFQGFEKESILRKVLVLFTSYKTSFTMLQARPYLYPAEKVDLVGAQPVRHFRIVSSAEEDRGELVSELEPYKAQGLYSDGVWVTPGLPHLVFMLGSLIVSVVLGDLLMWAFTRMVGYTI